MANNLRFALVDVFTDQVFGGNQLAVFPKADGLVDQTMAAIARELKVNESTFVTRSRKPGIARNFRIFSPHGELPFAGHPTVGTAAVLTGLAGFNESPSVREEPGGITRFTLAAPAGPIPIEVIRQGAEPVVRACHES